MSCPKCHSEDWRLDSIVHAGGLSEISTSTVGIGAGATADVFGGGVGLGAGIGSTTGKQQTELSKIAAPPRKEMRPAKAFSILGMAVLIVSVIFFGNVSLSEYPILNLLFIGVPIATLIAIGRLLLTPGITKLWEEKHRSALSEYEKKRMCLRCGTLYLGSETPDIQLMPKEADPSVSTKECPYCAEIVLEKSILCKHCHSKL